MAKTNEELQKLKDECTAFISKLQELSDEELNEVTGGVNFNTNYPFAVSMIGAIKEKLSCGNISARGLDNKEAEETIPQIDKNVL